ncbi:MAG: permease-like cell division protein FtsX [Nocardioidaceae bacterium]
MQISQIFAELGTGLRRNISMTISLVVTTFVSLTLVGFGLLVNTQVNKTEDFFGDRLQLQVFLCSASSVSGTCVNGPVTDVQRGDIEKARGDNPEVKSYSYQTSQQAYDKAKQLYGQTPSGQKLFALTNPNKFSSSYFVVLNDPHQFAGVTGQVQGMSGVEGVTSLTEYLKPLYDGLTYLKWASLSIAALLIIAAILQVSNTIRLTAYARRREIGIMRLVGASSWHIQLPFVLESLLAALLAGVLACGALAAFVQFAIRDFILNSRLATFTTWVGWHEAVFAGAVTLVIGLLLGLVPTLVLTRKYLDV